MPKIRGVKPDLWTDENFVELSPYARLLWIGMWNFACDNGHLQDKSKQIKLRVLPTDPVNAAELLREIEMQGLIMRGGGWITIPNLSHHQKPHKRWWSTCDKPGCVLPEGASSAPNNRGTTVAPPKGNRGTTADVDSDGEGDGDRRTPLSDKSDQKGPPDRFDEFWETYSKKVGRKKAETAYRNALKKPGVTPDLLVASAAAYITWQMTEGKHPAYTKDATTWLHGEHWRDERTPQAPARTRVQEHLALVQQFADEEAHRPQIGQRQ